MILGEIGKVGMRIENENREKVVDILLEKKMRVLQLVACSPLLYLYYNLRRADYKLRAEYGMIKLLHAT